VVAKSEGAFSEVRNREAMEESRIDIAAWMERAREEKGGPPTLTGRV
jgi:hypothetical protein